MSFNFSFVDPDSEQCQSMPRRVLGHREPMDFDHSSLKRSKFVSVGIITNNHIVHK
jgi:hypothetical protein